jgi:hypothetical protein
LSPSIVAPYSRASDGEALRSGRQEWRCNDGQADTEQQTHTGSLGDCITASTLMRFSIHTGGDCGGRPQIIVSSTWRTGRITKLVALAAAALEAANGMTSHSKTCYFMKCFARRWPRDAEFSNASGDFAVFAMGDD